MLKEVGEQSQTVERMTEVYSIIKYIINIVKNLHTEINVFMIS